jgi:hypothetical protein
MGRVTGVWGNAATSRPLVVRTLYRLAGRFAHMMFGENPCMATTKKAGAKKSTKKPASKKKDRSLTAAQRNHLDDNDFAFTKQRKEPIVDARHVRNAISRFDQVQDVTDAERDRAWKRIVAAAEKFGVEVSEHGWRELFKGPKSPKQAKQAKKAKQR